MPNSIFGTAPGQVPRNADLGRLAYVNLLGVTTVILTTGQAWSPPHPVIATIIVTGGGATGALRGVSPFEGSTGGGGGGTAIKFNQLLNPTTVYTAVVGAAGAVPSSGTTGNAGTTSTFSGADIATLTGNGGQAGQQVPAGVALSNNYVAPGGTASGGDINIAGGSATHGFTVANGTVGSAVSTAHSYSVMAQPGGCSYWGPAAGLGSGAGVNYGVGGSGTGANVGLPYAAKQGVIVILYT